MMNGRNNGKKQMAVRIVAHAFEIIHLLTDQNPIQVYVDAIINTGPREDSTRIGSQGTVRRQAVDVSPLRRVNQAVTLLTIGVRESAFRNVKVRARRDCDGPGLAMILFGNGIRLIADIVCSPAGNLTRQSISECLADELINAAKGSSNS